MAGFGYSITNTLDESFGPSTSHKVAANALRTLGLNSNALSNYETRVFVYSTKNFGGWGVDVPTDRAEEFAREVWKDDRTARVMVNDKDFPKPVEKTQSAEDIQKEFDAFKKKVLELAIRTKREEGWCKDDFNAAMKELGLEVPARKFRVVLEMDLDEVSDDAEFDVTDREAVKSFLKWDIDQVDIGNSVKSVEPIKD